MDLEGLGSSSMACCVRGWGGLGSAGVSAFGYEYQWGCQCTVTWCDCHRWFGTTSPRVFTNPNTYTWTVTVVAPKPNKALRWFDCYRGALPPLIPSLLIAIEAVRRRFQPVNAAERKRQKRKRFVQRLAGSMA